MPEYLAPGVHVEETQTGNKPIEGVSTTTTGLVGVTERGPTDVPQLVTSYGEYQRLFGGHLPQDEFTDGTGVSHAYLPHAVEGFFLNGGKRAYVTRVLRDMATRATRNLFFADPDLLNPGNTILLRAAQQDTGTAINPPPLYVMDPANFGIGDWVRVGDGSRAEYRQVTSIGPNERHVSVNFPLHNAHAAGSVVRARPITPLAALLDPSFTLVNATEPGALEITIANGDDAGLVPMLPPGTPAAGWQLIQVGVAVAAEYAYATTAIALGGGQVRLTLAHPLRFGYPAATVADVVETGGGTNDTLALQANTGELLTFVTTAPPPAAFTNVANIMIFEPGTDAQEAHGIGELSTLSFLTALPTTLAGGTFLRRVTAVDDDRTITLNADPVFTLDRVDGLAIGMTVTFEVGGVPEDHVIDAIDVTASTITLRTPLTGIATSLTVTIPPKHLTAAASAGALSIALDDRLGINVGDVLRLGVDEIVTVRQVVGERGAPPDAGAIILEQPLGADYALPTDIRRQILTVDPARQAAFLIVAAPAGATEAIVNDGTNYVAGDIAQLTLPDTTVMYVRINANATVLAPREIELSAALENGHDAGEVLVERAPLLEIRALDPGGWGNRLMVACRNELKGLVAATDVMNANPPPGPGMFSSLQLSSVTGAEPGTVLEMVDATGTPLALPLLKVRRVDRPTRLLLLDAPGLQPAHITAHANALLAGEHVRVRSREFSLITMLRQRPDPAVPTRDDNLIDQEIFRHLSMDPRHSRYIMRLVGATWTPPATDDDLGIPLRRWDRRSEGTANYVRVLDLEPVAAQREAIRLGPEALEDVMPSGLRRPARHRLSGGNDAVVTMNDAMYIGADSNDPDLRTGLYTLKNLLNVSLVAIPGQTSATIQQALIDHCEEMRYRFAALDGPRPPNDTVTDVQNHRQQYDTKYAALYHPWLTIADPFPTSIGTTRMYPLPPSGHMLGIYARVDNERGVHKAPANEVVRGILGLTRYFTKGEQEILNPYPDNINVIRDFRPNNRGIRIWGARCITSDNDYKYVNVRRLLIFIEDSIDRGLQWVVFEPNAEELWARVRRAVTNFLTTVWRNGALEGTTPEQGFFVKCDRTTMTRDDIDNGRLIVVIGVAPVKPAEFVIIRIGLWTADAEV
jgi:phage tail sheath protein FI